jgi:transcriptional regulator GlxA family with amidase domain
MSQNPDLIRRLLRAKDRIDAAPHEEWPIERLAEISAVSEAHFSREFKKAFGAPPHRYLLTRRIERATDLLRSTDLAIIDIALQTGWQSIGTFGRVFRDITGESPGELRSRERSIQDAREFVPECVVRASQRENLTSSVLEKRRSTASGKLEPPTD